MPNLCIKTRANGRTVQLIRHQYNSETRRSQTVTVGSLAIDADPDDFASDLRIRDGIELSSFDHMWVATWLRKHGDPLAKERRQLQAARIEARVRDEIAKQQSVNADPITVAFNALVALCQAFPKMANSVKEEDGDPRKAYRSRYLELVGEWDRWLKIAQNTGVARKVNRQSKAVIVG